MPDREQTTDARHALAKAIAVELKVECGSEFVDAIDRVLARLWIEGYAVRPLDPVSIDDDHRLWLAQCAIYQLDHGGCLPTDAREWRGIALKAIAEARSKERNHG